MLLSGASFGYYHSNISRPVSNSDQEQSLEVLAGQGVMEIAQNLKTNKLIRSAWVFGYYALTNDYSLKPGIYYLKQNMTIPQIAEIIHKGLVKENKITLIEGWRAREIAEYMEKNNIVSQAKFLKAAEGKEGYLFPDTYRLAVEATAEEIVKKLTDNFAERTKDLTINPEVVILASIIEREAKNDDERVKIAGVYQNRLKIDMKLEADPTVSYAKGTWSAPTSADLVFVDSPYNTYKYKGLPPGPISNPGLASIKAAQNPSQHDYYYFLHAKNGDLIMSKTLDEHNANKVKYLK